MQVIRSETDEDIPTIRAVIPSEAFMLLELYPDALGGHSGTVKYRPEFDLD